MEEDAEAVRAVDWDRSAADTAYRAEVERAQARARLVRAPARRPANRRMPRRLPGLAPHAPERAARARTRSLCCMRIDWRSSAPGACASADQARRAGLTRARPADGRTAGRGVRHAHRHGRQQSRRLGARRARRRGAVRVWDAAGRARAWARVRAAQPALPSPIPASWAAQLRRAPLGSDTRVMRA
jgi:hypothetical protein